MKLNIVGNTFKDNNNYPIAFELDYSKDSENKYEAFIASDGLLIKHNVLKGSCFVEEDTNQTVNPNNVYKDELLLLIDNCRSRQEIAFNSWFELFQWLPDLSCFSGFVPV
eukprot:534960_1